MTPGPPAPRVPADFTEFYAAHFKSLTIQLYVHTGDLAEAQDVVQEAFCRALLRWSQVSTFAEPVAWVRRVAWNLATSRWRRVRTATAFARRQREETVAGPTPDRVMLVDALARLPERQRRAVVLHYLADMSIPQISRELGVSPGTVKSWLFRARAALAAELVDAAMEAGVND